ncbi:hypothetical protein F5B22DRAFT_600977 [Xylaria bambusicola]|uniref:uncharacterized protein n=1 Tax=Xylaria bambusicola TaxID=326684 RepID=UPI002007DC83|nr:uncharacterized protein F5B22DRAFT_600977 [Xylaria bambusicola]KAI0517905.1 hypothetical protein F5B22DRAFT_600977 [Xylaria bambusicola]
MSVASDQAQFIRRVGFLELVPRIRELVYLYAGVISNATVPFDKENSIEKRGRTKRVNELRGPHLDWTTTLALLQTCRLVYSEVSSLIYSTNRFVTHTLLPLRNLTSSTLHSLSVLKVHVHAGTCEPDRDYCDLLYSGYHTGEQLDSSIPADARILDEWEATASHIGGGIQAGKLELLLICDVKTIETANLVVEPLRRWPQLSRCSIRLCNRPDSVLSNLASTVSRTLMGSLDNNMPFMFPRYQELPLELRLKVLQYTDLVTPWTEVSWDPSLKYHVGSRACCTAGTKSYPFYEFIDPESTAADCVSNWTVSNKDYRMFAHAWDPRHSICQFQPCKRMTIWYSGTGCFCKKYHAAYTPSCSCWQPPTRLFLVSKAFREEAAFTFFSSNHFNVRMGSGKDAGLHISRMSSFLTILSSANVFQYIKSLKIKFSVFINYLRPKSPLYSYSEAQAEWKRTIASISSNSNLRYLEIETDTIDCSTELSGWPNIHTEKFFEIARNSIDPKFWVLHGDGRPRGTRQLMVRMSWFLSPYQWANVYYNIRQEHEPLPLEEEYWGNKEHYGQTYRVSSCRSLVIEEASSLAKWVEQIWVLGDEELVNDPYDGFY